MTARTLGLLGGMGPAATVDVLDKIVKATPAARDQDHIPILVRCVPQIPDRTDALLGRGPSPLDDLVQGAMDLRVWGAQILAIACNTAHHWYGPVREAFGGPVVHIADAVAQALRERGSIGPIGIMATSGTMASGFYQRHLGSSGYEVLVPPPVDQSSLVDHAVARAKAGDWNEARYAARSAARHLLRRGAKQVVLACTELPLALMPVTTDRDLLDANVALAHACVRAALNLECDVAENTMTANTMPPYRLKEAKWQ